MSHALRADWLMSGAAVMIEPKDLQVRKSVVQAIRGSGLYLATFAEQNLGGVTWIPFLPPLQEFFPWTSILGVRLIPDAILTDAERKVFMEAGYRAPEGG